MAESYSPTEVREVVRSTRVDTIRSTADSIAHLRTRYITPDKTPAISGAQMKNPSLVDEHLGTVAPESMRTTMQRYREYHSVTTEWRKAYEENANDAEARLREQLDMGELKISEVRIGSDYVAVVMPEDSVNIYHQIMEERQGFGSGDLENGVWGFAGNLPLRGKNGKMCPVFIASDLRDLFPERPDLGQMESDRILAHEREHVVEQSYLARRNLDVDVRKRYTPARTIARKLTERWIADADETPEGRQEVSDRILRDFHRYLQASRSYLLNEITVEAASGNFINPEELLPRLLRNINPSPEEPGTERGYGYGIRDHASGVFEGMAIQVERGNLSFDEYAQVAIHMEEAMLQFQEQNRMLSDRYVAFWHSLDGRDDQINQFVSTLYAIPQEQLWKIEYFLHDDDHEALRQGSLLRRQLGFERPTLESNVQDVFSAIPSENREQILTWLLVERFRQLPDGKGLLKARAKTSERLTAAIGEIDADLDLFDTSERKLAQAKLLKDMELVDEEVDTYFDIQFLESVPAILSQLWLFASQLEPTTAILEEVRTIYGNYLQREFSFEQVMESCLEEYGIVHAFDTERNGTLEGIWGSIYMGLDNEEDGTVAEESLGARIRKLWSEAMESIRPDTSFTED